MKLRSRLPRFWIHLDVQALWKPLKVISTVTHLAWDLCIFDKLTHFCPLKYYLSHFIFTKIIKIFAFVCQILWLKCIKFDFGWGSAPDAAGELIALTALAGGKGARCPLLEDPTPCYWPFWPRTSALWGSNNYYWLGHHPQQQFLDPPLATGMHERDFIRRKYIQRYDCKQLYSCLNWLNSVTVRKSSLVNFFRVRLKFYMYLGKMLRLRPPDPDRASSPRPSQWRSQRGVVWSEARSLDDTDTMSSL